MEEKVKKMVNFLFVEQVTRALTHVPGQHYFLVSKTADFLNYTQQKGYITKGKMHTFRVFQAQRWASSGPQKYITKDSDGFHNHFTPSTMTELRICHIIENSCFFFSQTSH